MQRIAKQNINLMELGVFSSSIGQLDSRSQRERGTSSSQDENTELISVENMKDKNLLCRERRRSLSARR